MAPWQDTFAISALQRKRAHLAGEIEAAERALSAKREVLANLDGVIRLFSPETNPELIPAIRPSGHPAMLQAITILQAWAATEALLCRATGGRETRADAAASGVCARG